MKSKGASRGRSKGRGRQSHDKGLDKKDLQPNGTFEKRKSKKGAGKASGKLTEQTRTGEMNHLIRLTLCWIKTSREHGGGGK